METALRFSGYLGLVIFLFGLLGALIVGSFVANPLITVHLVLGILLLIAWAVTYGFKSMSQAGEILTGRSARFSANAAAYSVVFVGLLVVFNVFVATNDKRWDVTEAGVYSLSEKSKKLVEGLEAPLKLIALDVPAIQSKEKTEDVLKLYRYHNPEKVSFEILDPRTRPVQMDQLGLKQGNLLYIEYGDEANKSISRINAIDEASITTAVIKLTRGAAKKVYYVQGHGEPELDSAGQGGLKEFVDALKDEHIELEGLLLPQAGAVPTDAAALVFVAPTRPISQHERDVLVKYVNDGGRLLMFADAEVRGASAIRELSKEFGIDIGEDVIIDQQLRLFSGPEMAVQFVAQQFSPHPITNRLSQADPPVFTFASSVTPAGKTDAKTTYEKLLSSGPNSWAEKDLAGIFDSSAPSASLDANDLKGPVSLAVSYERKLGKADDGIERSARVLVFGDATWITNGNLAAMANRDLVLNAMNWALGEEGGVAIGPKKMRASVVPITERTIALIFALSLIGPELILIFGLFVWWRRRVAMA